MNRATLLVLLGGLALTTALIVAPGADRSGPFLPRSDGEVLEEVPKSTPRPTTPLTVDEAAARAKELIVEARRSGGDPRLLGRAQATLAQWWNEPAPPPQVRLLRATLKQSFHDFEGALVDLDAQVAADPSDEQAWLTRATVLSVLARYPEAERSCEPLAGVVATVCRAQVWGVTGRAKEAVAALDAQQATPSVHPERSRGERAWVLSVMGELERWAGDDARAATTLEQALLLEPTDTYTRLLLAQLQLDVGQPARAVKLFEGRAVNDGELLMLVLALKAAKAPEYDARRAELDERVAANRQRGETLHQREESRYALALEGDVAKALELATKNWAVQKEPADARVFLEAAAAAKDAKAAAPVLKWLDETKFTDPRLQALAKEVR